MSSIQTVHLNQISWKIPVVVHAVQGDTGRILTMVVDDLSNGQYSGVLSIRRPDETHYDITATSVGNVFTADITQALTQAGDVYCQLKVTISGTQKVSTYSFVIAVQEDTSGAPTEQEGWTILEALEAANSAKTSAEAALATAQEAISELESIYAGVVIDITDGIMTIGTINE